MWPFLVFGDFMICVHSSTDSDIWAFPLSGGCSICDKCSTDSDIWQYECEWHYSDLLHHMCHHQSADVWFSIIIILLFILSFIISIIIIITVSTLRPACWSQPWDQHAVTPDPSMLVSTLGPACWSQPWDQHVGLNLETSMLVSTLIPAWSAGEMSSSSCLKCISTTSARIEFLPWREMVAVRHRAGRAGNGRYPTRWLGLIPPVGEACLSRGVSTLRCKRIVPHRDGSCCCWWWILTLS